MVQRSRLAATTWTTVGTTAANTATFRATGLAPATTYRFRVRAENATGASPWSNVLTARTQR